MSRTFDPSANFDLDAALDRLVAAELLATDRQALLRKLDAIPDGWRRCALAFLEDQAWRSALIPPPVQSNSPLATTLKMQTLPRRKRATTVDRYVLAASLFAASAAACFQAGAASVGRPTPPNVAAKIPVLLDTKHENPVQPGQPLGWVGFVDPYEGEALPQQVPILASTEANQQWLQEQPATIPSYVKAQWERRGYQVEENRRLVGFDLQDGRRVAVPVDEVALDFVGQQPL